MSTQKNEADKARNENGRNESSTTGTKQNASAEFDKLTQEAEADAPRTRKPGASDGNNSEQHNNGRGGGK